MAIDVILKGKRFLVEGEIHDFFSEDFFSNLDGIVSGKDCCVTTSKFFDLKFTTDSKIFLAIFSWLFLFVMKARSSALFINPHSNKTEG